MRLGAKSLQKINEKNYVRYCARSTFQSIAVQHRRSLSSVNFDAKNINVLPRIDRTAA